MENFQYFMLGGASTALIFNLVLWRAQYQRSYLLGAGISGVGVIFLAIALWVA